MKKVLFAAIYAAIVAIPVYAQTTVLPPAALHATCTEILSFGAGEYDSAETIFGVEKDRWNDAVLSYVGLTAYRCRRGTEKQLYQEHRLSEEMKLSIEKTEAAVVAKAKDIVEQNKAEARRMAARRQEEERKQKEDAARLASERANVLAVCTSSNAYKMYETEDSIMAILANLSYVREQAVRESKIAQASGVRNLSRDYENGRDIVDLQAALKENWVKYKGLGGKARSPQKISHSSSDPCAGLMQP